MRPCVRRLWPSEQRAEGWTRTWCGTPGLLARVTLSSGQEHTCVLCASCRERYPIAVVIGVPDLVST
jgi:hypothetical protein